MSYSMCLDAEIVINEEFDALAKSYDEAVNIVMQNGIPFFISFGTNLTSKTSYDFAKWLVKSATEGILVFPENFSYSIHSGDPIEKNNISSILNNYLHFNVMYNHS